MRRHRLARPQRRPVFLGCEGDSERAYGALISRLYEEHRRDLYLDTVLLKPGGGDPLTLVERACHRIVENERKRDIRYAVRAVLLDTDRRGQGRRASDGSHYTYTQDPDGKVLALVHHPEGS
jgi:hypothetical protein